MKRLCLTALILLACCAGANAQFTISRVKPHEIGSRQLSDSIKWARYKNEFFSLAKYKAERRALIKERNTIEYKIALQGSTEQYNSSWKQSGTNNISGNLSMFCYHTFTKHRFSLTSKLDANYGITRIDSIWSKTSDAFSLYVAPAWKVKKNWAYGGSAKLRSQFTKGYKSRTDKTVVSDFMAPGYLDLNVGVTYTSPNAKFPFKVEISPVSGSGTFVLDDNVNLKTAYKMPFREVQRGVDDAGNPVMEKIYKDVKFEGGSSVQVSFDRTFGKSKFMRYRSTLYSFYGWMTDLTAEYKPGERHLVPTARWENWLDFTASKFLTTTIYWHFFYNREQVNKLQIKYSLSFGLSYYFKNK